MGDAGSRSVLQINGVRTGPSFVIKYLLGVSNRSGPGFVPGDAWEMTWRMDPEQLRTQRRRFIGACSWSIYKAGVNFVLIREKLIW